MEENRNQYVPDDELDEESLYTDISRIMSEITELLREVQQTVNENANETPQNTPAGDAPHFELPPVRYRRQNRPAHASVNMSYMFWGCLKIMIILFLVICATVLVGATLFFYYQPDFWFKVLGFSVILFIVLWILSHFAKGENANE